MKKFALLIALALCVTVGGVYATWYYTSENAGVTSVDSYVKLEMGAVDDSIGALGTFSYTDTVEIVVEPKEGTAHTTSLAITGSLTFIFTPDAAASSDVKENAVPATFHFALSNNDWKYEGTNLFTFDSSDKHDIVWVAQDDGTFTYTLNASDLARHIQIAEFTLDTKTDYEAFRDVLRNGTKIKFYIEEKVVTP